MQSSKLFFQAILRSFYRFLCIGLSLLCLSVSSANAATMRIDQLWNHFDYGIGTPPNLYNLGTSAIFSDSAITGIGIEEIIVSYMSITMFKGTVGQNFSRADFNAPHDLSTEGNVYARYNNGVFTYLHHVDQGGSARVQLRTGDLTGPVSGAFNIVQGELTYWFPVSGRHNYRLISTTESVLGPPSPIPVPAAVWLFGSALLGLIGFGKRWKAA